jgi:hypothetical protein
MAIVNESLRVWSTNGLACVLFANADGNRGSGMPKSTTHFVKTKKIASSSIASVLVRLMMIRWFSLRRQARRPGCERD